MSDYDFFCKDSFFRLLSTAFKPNTKSTLKKRMLLRERAIKNLQVLYLQVHL